MPEVKEEPGLQNVGQEQAEVPVLPTPSGLNGTLTNVFQQVKDHIPEPQPMAQASVEAGHKLPSPPPFPPSILAGGQCSPTSHSRLHYTN